MIIVDAYDSIVYFEFKNKRKIIIIHRMKHVIGIW